MDNENEWMEICDLYRLRVKELEKQVKQLKQENKDLKNKNEGLTLRIMSVECEKTRNKQQDEDCYSDL